MREKQAYRCDVRFHSRAYTTTQNLLTSSQTAVKIPNFPCCLKTVDLFTETEATVEKYEDKSIGD